MVIHISSHTLQQAGPRAKNNNSILRSILKSHFPGFISCNNAQANATAKSHEKPPQIFRDATTSLAAQIFKSL